MKLVEKFENIYQSYYKPVSEINLSTNYTDLFGNSNIIAPLHEYDFINQEIRFNKNRIIAGYKASDLTTVDDIYNLKDANCVDRHLVAAEKSFNLLKQKDNKCSQTLSLKMESYISFKGKGGKRSIYKRISVDTGRRNGQITHTATFLEEITAVAPQNLAYASIIINNNDKYDLEIEEVNKFKQLLSPREVEILGLISRGFTSADIAQGLSISVHTVKTQRKNMIRKLDVSNSAEMVNLARDMGLF